MKNNDFGKQNLCRNRAVSRIIQCQIYWLNDLYIDLKRKLQIEASLKTVCNRLPEYNLESVVQKKFYYWLLLMWVKVLTLHKNFKLAHYIFNGQTKIKSFNLVKKGLIHISDETVNHEDASIIVWGCFTT